MKIAGLIGAKLALLSLVTVYIAAGAQEDTADY